MTRIMPRGQWSLMKTAPFEHQMRALAKAQGRPGFGFLMEMGTGKSKTAIDEFCDQYMSDCVDRVLIVAGKGSYANWTANELPLHMWDAVEWMDHLWRNTGSMEERRQLRYLESDVGRRVLRILVVNVEAFTGEKPRKLAEAFVRGGRTSIVMDESTLIKNHEAQRTKFMIGLGRLAVYRRILTGSPVTRDPIDLWGQFEFLGPEMLGYRSFFNWRARYCVMGTVYVGSRPVKKPIAFVNQEELSEKVAQSSFRVTKEECLDLPPKVYQFRDVQMTEQQADLYKSMRQMALAVLQGEPGEQQLSTAKTAMSALLKMHQILCGHLRDDEGVLHKVPTRRIDALMDVVEEAGSASTVVWCAYRLDVDAVAEALISRYGRESVVTYDGRTSPADRQDAIARFQAGAARFFVATAHTAGRGITLTRGTTVVYYSNSHDLELRLQSEDRTHRIGQASSVNYVDLRVPETVDDKIVRSLRAKINIATLLMGDVAREWLT